MRMTDSTFSSSPERVEGLLFVKMSPSSTYLWVRTFHLNRINIVLTTKAAISAVIHVSCCWMDISMGDYIRLRWAAFYAYYRLSSSLVSSPELEYK